jgi:hypothetical protein
MELNKKVKIFGKQIPAVLLALVAIAGLASAGLLSFYGKAIGTATVQQSVQVNDASCTTDEACTSEYSISPVGGSEVVVKSVTQPDSVITGTALKIKNTASTQASIKLTVSYSPDGDGITTKYLVEKQIPSEDYSITDSSTITLSNIVADKDNDNDVDCNDVVITGLPDGITCSAVSEKTITLSDTTTTSGTVSYNADLGEKDPDYSITLNPNDVYEVNIKHTFALDIRPGTYIITTTVTK